MKYAGVLASASKWRARIAPKAVGDASGDPAATVPIRPASTYRPWADLLRRTFAVDALECPKCRGSHEAAGDGNRSEISVVSPRDYAKTLAQHYASSVLRTSIEETFLPNIANTVRTDPGAKATCPFGQIATENCRALGGEALPDCAYCTYTRGKWVQSIKCLRLMFEESHYRVVEHKCALCNCSE
jgi:hypothetical protein